jgi:hypothetical protein
MADTCNPSYSVGRDQEDHGSKPAQANSLQDPILKKTHHMPHYCQMDQENVVSIHNGILCSHEEERNVIIRW